MKLIDDSTSTQVEFKPPRRFSTIQVLKVIATNYSFVREFVSETSTDELIESMQLDGATLIVTWKRKPTTNEMLDIEWVWEHVCGQYQTRHVFEG